MFTLRDYQIRACDRIWAAWKDDLKRPCVVLPTGAGKTVTFVELIGQWLRTSTGRAVVLVHREELAQQTVDKIKSMIPDVSVGIVKAGRDETDATIVVCSAQTLARPGRVERLNDVGIVVVDECHHYAAKTWKAVLERFGCFDDDDGPVTVGFTATLSRGDGRGLGSVWDDVVYQRSIIRMIMDGHLCDVKAVAVEVDGLDLGTVARKAGGDFADGSLSDALEATGADRVIADAYVKHATGTDGVIRQGVVFTPTVSFAHRMSASLEAVGVTSAVVSGETSSEDRALIYKRYREGDVRVLCNCMVLTEGWDAPWAEIAVIARPTRSSGLYTQMVGRVLRTHPGKTGALVLDVCGSAANVSLCGLVDLSEDSVPPMEGETLTEAVERVQKEAREEGSRIPLDGVKARHVDLFAQSQGNWLKTPGGTWFNGTTDHTYFIWPAKGTDLFMVGRFDNKGSMRGSGMWLKDGRFERTSPQEAAHLPMDFALAVADGHAMEEDPSIGGKNAPWRKRKQPPTDAQVQLARRLGITFDATVTKGALSQLISIHKTGRKLDRKA